MGDTGFLQTLNEAIRPWHSFIHSFIRSLTWPDNYGTSSSFTNPPPLCSSLDHCSRSPSAPLSPNRPLRAHGGPPSLQPGSQVFPFQALFPSEPWVWDLPKPRPLPGRRAHLPSLRLRSGPRAPRRPCVPRPHPRPAPQGASLGGGAAAPQSPGIPARREPEPEPEPGLWAPGALWEA